MADGHCQSVRRGNCPLDLPTCTSTSSEVYMGVPISWCNLEQDLTHACESSSEMKMQKDTCLRTGCRLSDHAFAVWHIVSAARELFFIWQEWSRDLAFSSSGEWEAEGRGGCGHLRKPWVSNSASRGPQATSWSPCAQTWQVPGESWFVITNQMVTHLQNSFLVLERENPCRQGSPNLLTRTMLRTENL